MVNPLDLPGPQFLMFYAVVGSFVLVALWVMRSGGESGAPPMIDTSDPYLIAYLRGGANEAARVATASLIDRGFLIVNESEGTVRVKPGAREPTSPLERTVMRTFAHARKGTEIFQEPAIVTATAVYRDKLTRLGLLPDAAAVAERRRRLGVGLVILVVLAGAKIIVALMRGRTNIAFLVIMAVVFVVVAVKLTNRFRTARGTALLTDLRALFGRLKARASQLRPGATTGDVALAMAVFGLGVLPADRFPFTRRVFPKASRSSSSSCGASCGSSCGGGNGGGGCGGCGGGGGD